MRKILLLLAMIATASTASATASCSDSTSDTQCMQCAIYHEARGEPVDGQLAVALVILNRVESERFPDSVCDVIWERDQFSFIKNGSAGSMKEPEPRELAEQVAAVAVVVHSLGLGEELVGIPETVVWFQTSPRTPAWDPGAARVAQIGDHNFFASPGEEPSADP